jgi:hypothetical protein
MTPVPPILDSPALELVGDDAGGADFLKPDLGMGVQVAADRREFVGKSVDAVDCRHSVLSS